MYTDVYTEWLCAEQTDTVSVQLYMQLKMKYDVKGQLHKLIKPPKEEIVVKKKEDTIVHTVRMEEQIAFSNWINLYVWLAVASLFCFFVLQHENE